MELDMNAMATVFDFSVTGEGNFVLDEVLGTALPFGDCTKESFLNMVKQYYPDVYDDITMDYEGRGRWVEGVTPLGTVKLLFLMPSGHLNRNSVQEQLHNIRENTCRCAIIGYTMHQETEAVGEEEDEEDDDEGEGDIHIVFG